MPATRLLAATLLTTAALFALSSCSSPAPTATTAPATSTPSVVATQPAGASTPTSLAATPTTAAPEPATQASPTPTAGGSSVAHFTAIPWAFGQQVSYSTTSGSTTGTFTYSLVGREGGDWWMETKVQQTGQPYTIIKLLMTDPATGTSQVKRLIMQQQGQSASELPPQYIKQGQQTMTTNEAKVNQSIVGTETKTVKAGTFTNATHAKYVDGTTTTDGYFHSTVPIVGMLQVTATSSTQPPTTMELVSFRMSGATTEITGTIGTFPGS